MTHAHNVITVAEFIYDHLDQRAAPTLEGIAALKIIQRPLLLLHACKAELVTGGTQPFYDYDEDVIVMPSPAFFTIARLFTRPTAYASTLLHELVHWSGHRRRLGRQTYREMYDPIYCREELVAELGSALLCHDLSIAKRPTLPHARYLNHFLSALPNPAIDLSVALSQANQAAAFLTAIARRQLSGA